MATLLVACGGAGGGDGTAAVGGSGLPAFTGVWVIVFENHGDFFILNHADAKNFRKLASRYAVAGDYSDITRVIFVTFDEGDLDLFDQILFIAISPYAKPGFVSSTPFDHDNFLATVEDVYGLPQLGRAQGVPNMAELFQP